MAEHHPEPTLIPIPPEFPVTWANPEDENLPLVQDRQHAHNPVTPLTGWIWEKHASKVSSAGFAAAGQPIAMVLRRVNSYYYMAIVPTVPPEKMEEAVHHAEETLKGSIPTFANRWEEEWLPELKGYHDTWNKFDLAGASTQELLDHIEWSLGRYERLWDIHFEIAVPFLVAPSMFHDLYEDVFGESDALHSYKLLQGVENAS